jgi:hypothetical protein
MYRISSVGNSVLEHSHYLYAHHFQCFAHRVDACRPFLAAAALSSTVDGWQKLRVLKTSRQLSPHTGKFASGSVLLMTMSVADYLI